MAYESSLPIAIIPLSLFGACQCTDRNGGFEDGASPVVTGSSSGAVASTTMERDDASSSAVEPDEGSSVGAEDELDGRFLGVFHVEPWLIPLGEEVMDLTGSQKVANIEIRPDGTASMVMETCSLADGTRYQEFYWEPLPGPWIELLPGPGQDTLEFMGHLPPDTLRATIDHECKMLFEIDGELDTLEPFRPGRVCWVNRCMPNWTVEIDYCEGERPYC